MKTYGVGYGMTKYIDDTALSPWKKRNEKAFTQSNMPIEEKGNTTVNLSEASKQVQRAKRVIDSEPDIRFEKVRVIREEIQRGDYRIDYDRIAENMLGVFLDEMSAIPAVPSKIFLVECVSLLS